MNIVDTNGLKLAADNWNPGFEYVNDIKEAANLINLPHEDYPIFCESTKGSIEIAIDILKEGNLNEFNMKSLHGFCMRRKEYIRKGDYRTTEVMVGSFKPPHPIYLGQLMMSIFPVNKDLKDLEMWYRIFECIHPFEDGNGRLGGIILAAVSFIQEGKYKVPKRHTKETLKKTDVKHTFEDGCLYNLNQPAIILKSEINTVSNVEYSNQVQGILCREDGYKGILHALPYELTKHKEFNPVWWYENSWSNEDENFDLIKNELIDKIEHILVTETSIDWINIDKNTFKEASAFCKIQIDKKYYYAWLTWENCD